jgi:hypothetical protein
MLILVRCLSYHHCSMESRACQVRILTGSQAELPIPPLAWEQYGFREGEETVFLPGSRRSGGFGLSTPRLLDGSRLFLAGGRVLGWGRIAAHGQALLPLGAFTQPGERLLAVRGSGYAVGFVSRGPIYEEALRHPGLEQFGGK